MHSTNLERTLENHLSREQRILPRIPGLTIRALRLQPEHAGPTLSVSVRDISIQGIGVLAECALEPGTPLAIAAEGAGSPLAELSAQVRHATMLPDGRWLLGCRFSQFLTSSDLENLG